LAPQFVAYATAKVDVRNGDNVDAGNDQFHRYRHTSEVNKLPSPANPLAKGLVQCLKTKQRSR
jgi:hypothetical protein